MARRSFLAAVLLVSSVLGRAAAAEVLTEADVVRLAAERNPSGLAARAQADVAQAEVLRASLYPNPSLAWEREHLPGVSDGERVDELSVTFPVEVGGRRGAEAALARAEAARAHAAASRTRSEVVQASLYAFYDALSAAAEVDLARRTVARLDEAARVVARKQEEGATSGYERARLEVEAELARSALRQAEARAHAAKAELAVLLGVEAEKLELRGELAPAEAAPPASVEPSSRPSFVLLRTSESEASDAQAAAAWSWIPGLAVTGGLRVDHAGEQRLGYVAGVSLSLPVFSRGQELRAEADAQHRLAAAELRSAEWRASFEVSRAQLLFAATREELRRFDEATRERVELLERAAQSGYREGERSIVELVDAQRARTDVDRRRLELQLAARRAEVALRGARGEFE